MITLVFLLVVAIIVGSVFATEGGEVRGQVRRPTGLLTWLAGGNWPAKVGGGLLVVGVGALLRYALINLDVSPTIKLTTGVLAAAALGFASLLVQKGDSRRAVSLALGGAAFGVAYLTAYSAFALFGYLNDPMGLTLLALTSVAAGVFAVTRGALSLAVIAMLGAYLAPAFAIEDAGVQIVYGYYAGMSALTLGMVLARGWRPLIHLSFLFTLAGGTFFAWTARYYTPESFPILAPFLLLLAALHLAMPIAERGLNRAAWVERLDLFYLLALPAVTALLAVAIAPSRSDLSIELLWLGAIWLAGAVAARLLAREGFAFYGVIGILLIGFGAAALFDGMPWELIGLAFAVGALVYAALRSTSRTLHNVLAGLVLLLGAVHIIGCIVPGGESVAFANGRFIERLIGASLLIVAGVFCRRVRQALDTVLLSVGTGWAIIAIGAEIIRWDLVSVTLALHWLLILGAAVCFAVSFRTKALEPLAMPIAIGIGATAIFAAQSAPLTAAWISLAAAPLSLLALGLRSAKPRGDKNGGSVAAVIVAPLSVAVWAQEAGHSIGANTGHFSLALAAGTAVLALAAARVFPERSAGWIKSVTGVFAVAFALILAAVTLFDIERRVWSVLLELACLGGLGLLAAGYPTRRDAGDWIVPASIVGAALVLQANLLRWLGPPGTLSIADVARMQWPAVISLLWAAIGAALTLAARRYSSRALWVSGATLLVAVAVKFVLVDFGSLGELANILAVIAAGVVFMLVGWLAPIPPKAVVQPKPVSGGFSSQSSAASAATAASAASSGASMAQSAAPREQDTAQPAAAEGMVMPESYWKRSSADTWDKPKDSSDKGFAWTITLLIAITLLSSRCGHYALEKFRGAWRGPMVFRYETVPAPAVAATPEPTPAPVIDAVEREPLLGQTGAAVELTPAAATDQLPAIPSSENVSIRPPRDLADLPQIERPQAQTFHYPPVPQGKVGIEQLLQYGKLRIATASDIALWKSKIARQKGETQDAYVNSRYGSEVVFHRTYVVTSPMAFPAGLHGAHAATFIVPRGVRRPEGDPGHSQILDMNR